MVQVDVFWSYAIGAGFAVAATEQIAASRAPTSGPARHPVSPYFVATLLYLSLLFAPSGMYLLWAFPDWETMQVAHDHASIPAWLVSVFAITNVTQGLLGYWVAERLIRSGHRYAAFLQMMAGYFAILFILVHGWDGRGYQRFFSPNRNAFLSWPPQPSLGTALARVSHWVGSPVALTLAAMSVIVVVLLWMMAGWLRAGYRLAGIESAPGPLVIVAVLLTTVFGVVLASAIVASVLVHVTGWWVGVPVSGALMWLLVISRRIGLGHKLFELLQISGPSASAPVPPAALAHAES